MPGCCDAGAVDTGGALISGVNRLAPVGLKLFSVGEDGVVTGLDDGVVVMVAVVGGGTWLPLLAHPAVRATISMTAATSAAPPATAIMGCFLR